MQLSDKTFVSFGQAIAAFLARGVQDPLRQKEPLRRKVVALHQAYQQGANSAAVDIAAYLTVRAPATFAAISAVLESVAKAAPQFAPKAITDVGAGPGTASFAAAASFASLRHARMIEADARFATVAQDLAVFLPFTVYMQRQSFLLPLEKSDLLIASYVLAELPLEAATGSALHLWHACDGALVLVEPGTQAGFARIHACREALLKAGADIIGPCTHDENCPMRGSDWCHFKTRLARSRQHMHAKSGTVPFEDEAYSWLAVARFATSRASARIMAPPIASKAGIALRLCSKVGLHNEMIAVRDKALYKQARKLKWGEEYRPHDFRLIQE